MQNDLVAVATLFACSLMAAVVLFKVLQSTAVIQKKEYQVGGAAAGFLVIYAALYSSYHQLQGASLETCQVHLLKEVTIQGSVDPSLKEATIILGRESATLDDSGRFFLTTKGIPQSVYVIKGETHVYHTVWPGEDLTNIRIPLP